MEIKVATNEEWDETLKAIEALIQKMQYIVSKAVAENRNGGGSNIYKRSGSYDGDSAPNVGGVDFIEYEDDDGGFDFMLEK